MTQCRWNFAVQRPNILNFMTDQEQADVLCPDHPCSTPHASRLAREAVKRELVRRMWRFAAQEHDEMRFNS